MDTQTVKADERWKRLLDPSTDDFWKEGNHIPDEGFLLLLKHRRPEDARNWLLRMEKKAEIAEEVLSLTSKAQKDLVREGKMKDRYHMVSSDYPEYEQLNKLFKDVMKSLTYFFIFRAECHASQRTAEEIRDFNNVIPLQATSSALYHWKGLPESKHASPETLKDYAPDGVVPVVVIADRLHNRVVRLSGAQSKKSLTEASLKLVRMRKDTKERL
ncbi:MAG: hypothetical protein H6618_05150 [Deltaproteobacteria bacterium]|nr:hypothetical protein [Deltaproteobacteria bacterium]